MVGKSYQCIHGGGAQIEQGGGVRVIEERVELREPFPRCRISSGGRPTLRGHGRLVRAGYVSWGIRCPEPISRCIVCMCVEISQRHDSFRLDSAPLVRRGVVQM